MTAKKTKVTSAEALKADSLTNFSGGPNWRDAPLELQPAEVEDAFNCTFDERGGAASRLGYTKRNSTPLGGTGDKIINDAWSKLLGKYLTQAGKSLYLDDGATAVHTFTTADCFTFAETDSLLVVAHPVDGLYTSPDGSTWTKITATNAPTTNTLCVAAWEARLFVGLSDGSVHWSAIGDVNTWSATDFNEIWTIDQEPIVNLHVGSGQDIQGRPGLLVFKNESVYRINDPSTGAYTTIDATNGAAGPKAVVGVGARVCWIGKRGVFWWREDQAAPVEVSGLLYPLWRKDLLNIAAQQDWCAGRRLARAYFSLSRAGSSVNDLALELDPDQGWLTPRDDAVNCYATSTGSTETTSGGSVTADGQAYTLDIGGTDDGAAISWRLQVRWLQLNGGFDAYVWLVRIHGRGSGTMTVLSNLDDTAGTDKPFDLEGAGAQYDTGLQYDTDWYYTTQPLQQTQAFYSVGRCRQFSLKFSGSTSGTALSRDIFGDGAQIEVGEFGLFGFEWLYVPLGLS